MKAKNKFYLPSSRLREQYRRLLPQARKRD